MCAYAAFGCRSGDASCPGLLILDADPQTLPPGEYRTHITVRLEGLDPDDERTLVTMLSAPSGRFGDVYALDTTYACDPEAPTPVEICVDAQLLYADDSRSPPDVEQVGSSSEYLQEPHIEERTECTSTTCIDVGCPLEYCPQFEHIIVSPLTTSLHNKIDVETLLFDDGTNTTKVNVSSDCGTVADPTQTGSSETTVTCENVGYCSITVRVTDERYAYCDGTGHRTHATSAVRCLPGP